MRAALPRWRLLAAATCFVAGCPAPPRTETFTVRVFGPRAALEADAIRLPGFAAGPLYYTGFFYRDYVRSEALASAPEVTAFAGAADGGAASGSVRLRPFVCPAVTASTDHAARGWSFEETHELLLTPGGELVKSTDLDRILKYSCTQTAPDGDGEKIETLEASLGECGEPERSATAVSVTRAGSLVSRPRYCQAKYASGGTGVVLSTDDGAGRSTAITLDHCLEPATASYPVVLTVGAGWPASGCELGPSLTEYDQGKPAGGTAESGTWTIRSIDFRRGGHLVGDVDVTFRTAGGEAVVVRGHVDVPLLRVPSR